MLLYASGKAFPHKTFVLSAKGKHTIARVRAQLMHVLFEMGRDDHQFRLRFNGQFLKDGLTLDDYGIVDNAVLKMIPMAKDHDSLLDLKSISTEQDSTGGAIADMKTALLQEIDVLKRREKLTYSYHGFLSMHFIGAICSAVSGYWYTVFYHTIAYIICAYYAPKFSHLYGFTGNYTISPKLYCLLFSPLMIVIAAASAAMSSLTWISIVDYGCPGWEFVNECSHHNVYTAVFFGIHSLVFIMSAMLLLVMYGNYRFQTGDYIEVFLVQTRDVMKIFQSAKSSKVKERRVAAFELASMTTTSDDNKFLIVAHNGLDVLISLSLTDDQATQEYAAEALAELLTIPEIQNKFVEIGGVRNLTALLHSKSDRCVQEAMTALSYIVQDNEQNKMAVISDRGLEDLCKAAYRNNLTSQKTLSGIFLELVFTKDIRDQMASMNSPALALIHLCSSVDAETKQFALQSLELLAIESPDTLCAQRSLIPVLLQMARQTVDTKILSLAAKLLLYFAENIEARERLIIEPYLTESLMLYSKSSNPLIQKVVVKIIYCLAEHADSRIQVLASNLDQVLMQIKENATDRDVWVMADSGMQMLNSSVSLSQLPKLSTADKVIRMHSHTGSSPGSSASSRASLRSLGGRT